MNSAHVAGRAGRSCRGPSLAPMPEVLAVDIGGTKIEVGLVDDEGAIGHRERRPTARPRDAEALYELLIDLVACARSASDVDVVGCGVGTGGPMTAGGRTVSPLNIGAWRAFPLLERLTVDLQIPVHIDNDAKALALGEAWMGAARGESNFIAMVVSTGIGGGIVLDGRLLDGIDGNAGHIGHVVVATNGHSLPGHVRGVLEAEASGTAIEHHSGRPAAEADAEEIARVGTLVGQAIGSVANLLDLRLALVAGSVALGYGDAFFAAAQLEVDRTAQLDHSRGTIVRPAGLGADGPLVGAAAVCWRALGHDIGVR